MAMEDPSARENGFVLLGKKYESMMFGLNDRQHCLKL
jgi:hypothetical protein